MRIECGWLSPTGEFTECKQWEHFSKAQEIIGTIIGNPDETLYNQNWIKIGYDGQKIQIDMICDFATEQQKLYLEHLYNSNMHNSFSTQALRNLYYCGVVDELETW